MNKNHKIIMAVVVLAGIVAAFAWWKSSGTEGAGAGDYRVETATLERGDIIRSVATSGAVRPLITVEVGSQLSGQVAEIYADFNTPVKKDQVIALIDAKTFETRVLQDQANLEVAESNIIVQRAGIDRAAANLRKARLEYERAEPLSKKGTLSEADYEAALAQFESAKADLTMAEAQLANARAALAQRKASLESSQIDLERTRIRSPIDGVVIQRAVDQGQTVAASLSSPILFLIAQDLSEIQIEANVDEADIGNIRAGNEASFTVDAYPNDEFSGRVDQVRLAPNEQNNVVTYTVIITAKNPQQKLLPGMTAIVEIVTGSSEDVLRVPNQALRFKPPADSELASLGSDAGAGQGGGQGGGQGRGGRDMSRMADQLGLSPEQVSAIEQEMAPLFQNMRSQMQGGGDPELLRAQMRQKIASIFRTHLTHEQYEQYEQQQSQRAETRSGQLWLQDEAGEIRPVTVRFGINDDNYTQVISRELEEGVRVVTRMRSPPASN